MYSKCDTVGAYRIRPDKKKAYAPINKGIRKAYAPIKREYARCKKEDYLTT